MIYIELMGGLGNQLFQIFCGIAYSLENKVAFKINNNKHDKVSPLDNTSLRPTYFHNFLLNLSNFTYQNQINLPIYREKTFFKYDKIPIILPDFKIWGYYQSYKYFESQYENIVKMIGLENQKNRAHEKNKSLFNGNKKPISLHFRIGDYIKNQKMHPILPIDYYIKSINLLKSKLKDFDDNYYLLIFGEINDKQKILDNVQKINFGFPNLEIVICNYNIQDYEQMLLMSLCEHNIIANSSFSWWGAYFNNNEKIVCYPSGWNGSTNETHDLFPTNWNKIII